ncbi:MAG: aspartate/tyrosine/aromatic aminotransferase, partial [Gammaproteobacteria bacterium]|nr:aspartate/tyrosine/aromatic aminotransferase [Gammaproteobacteria bacterium]
KIDLSVGVYQDDRGRTPILEAVKQAEREWLEAEDTKTYVAIAGNAGFNRGIERLLLGDRHPALDDGRISTVQSPGGSGGLSVAGHLIQRARPGTRVHISDPSWPNHVPLLKLSGLELETYPYYDRSGHRVDFDAMVDAVRKIPAGDVLLLHGCCHNPCGADLKPAEWQVLAELCERRGIVPFVDLAYQGLAEGLDEDAYGARLMAERVPEAVFVTSCSKNLGLYRERVGAVCVLSQDAESAKAVASNAANVARSIYSMPPDHGAAIVDRILHDQRLKAMWIDELGAMRDRLNGLRRLLVDKLAERGTPMDFSFIANERGMFSFLGLSREQVVALRERFHVYMVESSRINIAGINAGNADYVADSIAAIVGD